MNIILSILPIIITYLTILLVTYRKTNNSSLKSLGRPILYSKFPELQLTSLLSDAIKYFIIYLTQFLYRHCGVNNTLDNNS